MSTLPAAGGGRELGFWMCTALVVGNVIGMGIFVLPASLAPFGYTALAGWVLTVAGCLVLARVFASLAREMPQADGPYVYIRAQFGDGAAFIAIWCYWVSLWITNASLATGVVGYLVASMPQVGAVHPALLALALLWLFVAINWFGARAGGGVQVLTTVLKLVPMVVVIALGAWFAITAPKTFMARPVVSPSGVGPLLAASTIALFAMLGLESATVPSGKVRDPERTIPRATLVGTLIAGLIYVAISAIPLLILPQAQVAASGAPFVDLIDHWFGAGSGRWLGLFVVISGLGALNGWTLLTGELTRSMSAQGVMPAVLRRDNAYGAPGMALVLSGALASVMVAMNYSKSMVEGFTFLTTVVTAANLPLYLFSALALARMGGRAHALRWNFLVLGLLGTFYSVIAFVGVGGKPFLWALALAVAGLPVYFGMRLAGTQPVATAP